MIQLLFLSFGVPVLTAIYLGLRGFRDAPHDLGSFAKGAGFALAWGVAAVFLWHAVWLGALMTAAGGNEGLVRNAALWTVQTAPIWVPALVITYVLRAMKARAA